MMSKNRVHPCLCGAFHLEGGADIHEKNHMNKYKIKI